ncbi:MAG: hypothetical protein ACLFVQ_03270 [Chitinispirillaceae bacterium]
MLKTIARIAQGLCDRSNKIDPSRFNDPVASKTDWQPLKGGGANFKTHNLKAEAPDRLVYKASIGARLFYLAFLLSGLAMVIFITPIAVANLKEHGPEMLLPSVVGLIFTIVGALIYRNGTKPIVFDRQRGFFWRGKTPPDQILRKETLRDWARLDDIHALQILRESIGKSGSSSYRSVGNREVSGGNFSYELNLVLKDASRVNVIDHGSVKEIREDAESISRFLGVQVWDAA